MPNRQRFGSDLVNSGYARSKDVNQALGGMRQHRTRCVLQLDLARHGEAAQINSRNRSFSGIRNEHVAREACGPLLASGARARRCHQECAPGEHQSARYPECRRRTSQSRTPLHIRMTLPQIRHEIRVRRLRIMLTFE